MAKQNVKQDLLPGTLDMLIIKSLTRGVMHGYGIAEHIRQLSDEVLRVEEGSLYPALQRLQLQLDRRRTQAAWSGRVGLRSPHRGNHARDAAGRRHALTRGLAQSLSR